MNELLKNHKITPGTRKVDPVAMRIWSPRNLSIIIQKDKRDLPIPDQKLLELLYDEYPEIKEMEQLILCFKRMFQTKEEGALRRWLDDMGKSTSALKRFAKGIQFDFDAVNKAVITPYSNGQVEGQVNRLNNVKSRMYGRAGFELRRRMVIFKSGLFTKCDEEPPFPEISKMLRKTKETYLPKLNHSCDDVAAGETNKRKAFNAKSKPYKIYE